MSSPATAPAQEEPQSDQTAGPAYRGSLFNEMFDWMLAPFLLVWPLTVGLTYLLGTSLANTAFDRSLASKTRALAEQIDWQHDNNSVRLRADLKTLLADDESETYFFRIENERGEFLLGEPELPALSQDQIGAGGHIEFRTVDFRESALRIAALRHAGRPDAPQKPLLVQVGESTERRAVFAREIMKWIVLPQLFVIPLMVLLMWLGLRRGAAPLERLGAQVMSRAADDLRPLSAPDAPDEVAPLINSFNDLLDRMAREGEAQKRFIANAAHQLRTPLAGIKMQTELALRSADAAERNGALNLIATGTARTAHLINQLLVLARSEGAATDSLPLSALDFGAIARDVVAAAYPFASNKNIDLGLDVPDQPVDLRGHPDLLRELVSNLVDNAIRYTPPGGNITVRVTSLPAPALEVEDDGAGIPQAERELVFERFYRVLGSQEAGSGIGLAIVREIAARHGAKVRITTPLGGRGSIFTVQFPETPAPPEPLAPQVA